VQYLLDTNICIYLMREQPPEVAERFARLRVGDVVMSAVTCAELRHGVERCGVAAAPARRRDALDRLIAAHAISVEATLVTNDEKGFRGYAGLKVENWVG
jgi:tRNA(fMet)-specific endonuclease VapC